MYIYIYIERERERGGAESPGARVDGPAPGKYVICNICNIYIYILHMYVCVYIYIYIIHVV